ncbi:hypothetical protein XU18_1760 [Perkinsela sp. CCAP 1560/4]|nr:hypothetical protein XU18_1760 [Perkinsela sp. CCAP 1560/4]|eukprot:KNH07583.1 hypothetical protein XU18_1760 [Perkinsela sp. CCAP 1560/4]
MRSITSVNPIKRDVQLSLPLMCTLYRAVLKEAKRFDAKPHLKFFSPLTNPVIQKVLGTGDSILYQPDIGSYVQRVRKEFRCKRIRNNEEITAAFEVLNSMKSLASSVERLNTPMIVSSAIRKFQSQFESKPEKYQAKIQAMPSLSPGTVLLSHPIANSFLDRRVVMIVENENNIVTGVVLDLPYNTTITKGNPIFPEVFWGHEILQGGPYHVEITMPPSAFISVLHTGVISKNDIPNPPGVTLHNTDMQGKKVIQPYTRKASGSTKIYTEIIPQSEQCGTEPLYYSRVEALPKLAAKVIGQPRKNVRVYWGAMYWSAHNLQAEIEDGLWFPVSVSSSFFRPFEGMESDNECKAKSVSDVKEGTEEVSRKTTLAKSDIEKEKKTTKTIDPYIEAKQRISQRIYDLFRKKNPNFPTLEELDDLRSKRCETQGHDIQRVDAVFPPEPPVCRREPLWDQIMWALGGEYRQIVGHTSPLVVEHSRRPSMSAISEFMDEQ